MLNYTVEYGTPSDGTIQVWRDLLIDAREDYLCFRVGTLAENNIKYIMVYGGEIEETATGYSFTGSDIIQLTSVTAPVGGAPAFNQQVIQGQDGTVSNPNGLVVWSSVGISPKLQMPYQVREGVALYAFSLVLAVSVAAVLCAVRGCFAHISER